MRSGTFVRSSAEKEALRGHIMTITAPDRVGVSVHTDDHISRAGLLAQLRHRPEVRLLDDPSGPGSVTVVVADDVDGHCVESIRAQTRAGARVVLLVAHLDDGSLMAAVEAGVSSVLVRSSATADAVVAAVRSAACGGGTMPPEVLGRLLDQVRRLQNEGTRGNGSASVGFTDREIRVLGLVADGYDTAEVGRRLFCSERTVKNVIHSATTRLELRNRTHAVAFALRRGLI